MKSTNVVGHFHLSIIFHRVFLVCLCDLLFCLVLLC